MNVRRAAFGAVIIAFAALSAGVAKADGVAADPVLKMGGGSGSPDCIQQNNMSFQGHTDGGGFISAACHNNGNTDITTYSFQMLFGNTNGGISPILDNLLAPFTGTGGLSLFNWTASCVVTSGGVDICTATQSKFIDKVEDLLCATNFGMVCSQLASLSATQMKQIDPAWAFKSSGGNPCLDAIVYVVFGIIPGCDISASTVPNGGVFAPFASFDLAPAGTNPAPLPEPSSLSLVLLGFMGLPFLRRKLSNN